MALDHIELKAYDILNTYVADPAKEKAWKILDSEFGSDYGKKALVVRVLYGLKVQGHLSGIILLIA